MTYMSSWALKTSRICALDYPFDSTAMGISISIRTSHILPTGMMKLWYNHLDGRSRGVVYLDIYGLVGPKNKLNLCSRGPRPCSGRACLSIWQGLFWQGRELWQEGERECFDVHQRANIVRQLRHVQLCQVHLLEGMHACHAGREPPNV